MSHRPIRSVVPTGAPGTRNSPERVERHRAKMMGKFFRNQDPAYRRGGTVLPQHHKGVI